MERMIEVIAKVIEIVLMEGMDLAGGWWLYRIREENRDRRDRLGMPVGLGWGAGVRLHAHPAQMLILRNNIGRLRSIQPLQAQSRCFYNFHKFRLSFPPQP